jgi:signal transduction histidine kinase/DNA-binding response OmpR family regulator
MLVGALIWVVYEIVSFALGEPREIAAIGITGTSLGVIASIWSHYRDRSHWPIHLFAFAIAMSTALSAWVTRGGDEGMMVFTAIPAMIAIIVSTRAGWLWWFAGVASLVTVRLLSGTGYLTTITHDVVIAVVSLTALMVAGDGRRYLRRILEESESREKIASERMKELERLRAELESKNERLDAVNAKLNEQTEAMKGDRDLAVGRAKEAVEFLNQMSHEIRTPLNGVLGITDVLLGTKLDVQTQEHVKILASSGKLLRRLVDEVLDLARLDAGKFSFIDEPFDPVSVAEDVADLFAAQASAKGVVLTAIAPMTRTPHLVGDAMRVRQVLQNLVGNATKFTNTGHVRIDIEFLGNVLRYTVTDTGIGMARETLDRIFLEYAQDSAGARQGGTGLGLVIARKLARAMGGDVSVLSTVGRGSEFTASFKLKRATHEENEEGLSQQREHIGLVEPDETLALAIIRAAEHVGATVFRGATFAALQATRGERAMRVLCRAEVAKEGREIAWATIVELVEPTATQTREGYLSMMLPPRRARILRLLRSFQGRARESTHFAGRRANVSATGLPPLKAPEKRNLRALIVDDEPVNLKVLALFVGREGWSTETASSGAEAIEKARASRFDILLLDLRMPGMNGIETAIEIRKLVRPRPWLVLQTATIDGIYEEATKAGFADALTKPIEPTRLRMILGQAAQHRALQNERAARGLPEPQDGAASAGLAELLVPLVLAITKEDPDHARVVLGELQLVARRRMLHGIDRACSQLYEALLDGDGVEALLQLESEVHKHVGGRANEGESGTG